MSRILAFVCSWMGGGIGWWLGSQASMTMGLIGGLIGSAVGLWAGFEIVRRFRP